jgi:hypothetical protein
LTAFFPQRENPVTPVLSVSGPHAYIGTADAEAKISGGGFMIARRTLWALLPLFILGCSDDSSPLQPPATLTPDEQTVANVRAIRDGLETYAAAHNGTYGEYDLPLLKDLGLEQMTNAYTGELEPSSVRATFPGQIGIEAYTCGGTVSGYRITGYGKDHLLITLETLEKVPADVRYSHDITVANAFLVMDAARRYSEANNGVFPADISGDMDGDGKTLQDLLLDGTLLINPFTSLKTEPQDGLGLAIPGAIGYSGADSGSGDFDTYTMEAYDCDGAIMLTMVPCNSAYGSLIWIGSHDLRTAVEMFASASGHFPHNLDSETTPGGKTVLDLLSQMTDGHVPYIPNPYNQAHYVPTLGIATGNFTLAYQPIETAGTVTDYVITGRGAFEEIIRLGPKPLN